MLKQLTLLLASSYPDSIAHSMNSRVAGLEEIDPDSLTLQNASNS